MSEHVVSAADLKRDLQEKESRIKGIITAADELIARDIQENGQPEDSRRFYASATYREGHDNDRMGLLSFTKHPEIDSSSFLEITYNEHGFGEHREETDKTYTLSRTGDGDIFVQVSDDISADNFNALLKDAAEFGDTLGNGTDLDPEMQAAAWEDIEANVHEAVTGNKTEASLSLRPATSEDIAKLDEILRIAKDRTNWDQLDHEEEMAAYDTELSDPVRSSRIRKLVRLVGGTFSSRRQE